MAAGAVTTARGASRRRKTGARARGAERRGAGGRRPDRRPLKLFSAHVPLEGRAGETSDVLFLWLLYACATAPFCVDHFGVFDQARSGESGVGLGTLYRCFNAGPNLSTLESILSSDAPINYHSIPGTIQESPLWECNVLMICRINFGFRTMDRFNALK